MANEQVHVWDVDNGKRQVTAEQLLNRTVLYKVGHHGSHNATLREKGLEMMTDADLVAMVPVDVYIAHEKKRWTRMPGPGQAQGGPRREKLFALGVAYGLIAKQGDFFYTNFKRALIRFDHHGVDLADKLLRPIDHRNTELLELCFVAGDTLRHDQRFARAAGNDRPAFDPLVLRGL